MNFKQIDATRQDCHEALQPRLASLGKLKNKSLFLTGAGGFMGKWILEAVNYLNENHSFNIQVHAHSQSYQNHAKQNPWIYGKDWIKGQEGDIKSLQEIDPAVSYVLHFAGNPDNRVHSSNPTRVFEDIVFGTNRVLHSLERCENLENFIFMSSGMVYGPQPYEGGKIHEDSFQGMSSTSPQFYAEAKRAAESLIYAFKTQFRIPVTLFRPFSFIGPYQFLDRPWAINNFIRDGLAKSPIRILGDDQTLRSYMYPSEMALWVLLTCSKREGKGVFNLGSSDAKTIREIAHTVEQGFGQNLGVLTNGPSQTLPRSQFIPDTGLFEKTYNIKLSINTEKAIEKTIQWHLLGN